MPEHKKQHFVPKFYLKKFSTNGKSINIYNFGLSKVILNANLRKQCYRDNMYGEDGKQEKQLSIMEGEVAKLLKLIEEFGVPPPLSDGHTVLCMHIAIQFGRTAYMADVFNEMADGMWKSILKHDSRVTSDMLENVKIGFSDPANFALQTTLKNYQLIQDLSSRLLILDNDCEFITSDNPVVFYNQLMEFENSGTNVGLVSKGLQIFYPITPKILLYMYDSDVYTCPKGVNGNLKVSLSSDIFSLNLLQVAVAQENVYFLTGKSDIYRVADAGVKRQPKSKSQFFEGPLSITDKGAKQIVGFSRKSINARLVLSFVRTLKPAKKWRDMRSSQTLKPVSVVRNEALIRHHKKFWTLVDKNNYQPTDFLKYLNDHGLEISSIYRASFQ